MKTDQEQVIKNAGSYFAGWVTSAVRPHHACPTWTPDKSAAVRYTSEQLAKFRTLAGFRRLGTVTIENA